MQIISATTAAHISEIRTLFREYAAHLSIDLDFQGFETELTDLPGYYGPPTGVLLLAMDNESVAGCVAIRSLGHGACEMKRLYVRPQYRRKGMGRELVRAAVDRAAQLGYHRVRLDTLESLTAAMALYQTMGFKQIPPYYDNPLSGVHYWELKLR